MFAVCVKFEIDPTQMDAFMVRVRQQAEDSLRKEEACSRFDVWTDPGREGQVFLYEIYADADAFRQHLDSDHFKSFDLETRNMIRGKTVETWSGAQKN